MAQQILSTNTFTTAKWIVSATASNGTHTTIAAALTSASSGDTIFIRPGTYIENITLKAGVNLSAFGSDSSLNGTGSVIISGTCTMTTAGSVTISGIQLQTNSAALLAVTGSAASIVNLNNCYLNCTNTTGITFSSSSSSAKINMVFCYGDLGTTGIGLFTNSSAGTMMINNSYFTNSGGSSTASTLSAGSLNIQSCVFFFPLSTSSTGSITGSFCLIDTSAQNATSITTAGTGGSNVSSFVISSGTASSISVGAGTTFGIVTSAVGSTNTNAITGAGSISYSNLSFANSSQLINTTSQGGGIAKGIISGSAPSAGFIGEQFSSAATAVSISDATPKTITSITVTAGVWDISVIGQFINTGFNLTVGQIGISTTTNTFQGNSGDQVSYLQSAAVLAAGIGVCVPQKRFIVTTSTTYYAVGQGNFAAGTGTANARITATRVG